MEEPKTEKEKNTEQEQEQEQERSPTQDSGVRIVPKTYRRKL